MKKATHLTIVITLFFSNILNLCATEPCSVVGKFVQIRSTEQRSVALAANLKSWENPKTAENLLAHIDAKIKDLMKQKAEKQAKRDDPKAHLNEKQKDKITLSIKDLDSRLAELHTSKADMYRLSNDPNHIYTFSQTGENCVIKVNDKEVKIQGANDALLIHEIRHVSMWLQTGRSFRFSKYDLLMPIFADGSVDELQSYRAQYAFEPNSLPGAYPTDMQHVNIEFISKIQREDSAFAYPSIRQMWQADLKIVEQQAKLKRATYGTYVANDAH